MFISTLVNHQVCCWNELGALIKMLDSRDGWGHRNVSPVSIWDIKEPLRMTRTLAVTPSVSAKKCRLIDNVVKNVDDQIAE